MESFYYIVTKSGSTTGIKDSMNHSYKWGSNGFGTLNYDKLEAGTYELAIRGGSKP